MPFKTLQAVWPVVLHLRMLHLIKKKKNVWKGFCPWKASLANCQESSLTVSTEVGGHNQYLRGKYRSNLMDVDIINKIQYIFISSSKTMWLEFFLLRTEAVKSSEKGAGEENSSTNCHAYKSLRGLRNSEREEVVPPLQASPREGQLDLLPPAIIIVKIRYMYICVCVHV